MPQKPGRSHIGQSSRKAPDKSQLEINLPLPPEDSKAISMDPFDLSVLLAPSLDVSNAPDATHIEQILLTYPFAVLGRGRSNAVIRVESEPVSIGAGGIERQTIWKVSPGPDGACADFERRLFFYICDRARLTKPVDKDVYISVRRACHSISGRVAGNLYKRMRVALDRLRDVRIESKNIYWRSGQILKNDWDHSRPGLIQSYAMSSREELTPEILAREGGDSRRVIVRVRLSDEVYQLLESGRYVPIDYESVRWIKLPAAERLFELLEVLRLLGEKEIKLKTLAEHLPLAGYYHVSKIKEKLAPAFAELIRGEYLGSVDFSQANGGWHVSFRWSAWAGLSTSSRQAYAALVGVPKMDAGVALDLVKTYNPERIQKVVRGFYVLKRNKTRARPRGPGWVVDAIRNDYELTQEAGSLQEELPTRVSDEDVEWLKNPVADSAVEDLARAKMQMSGYTRTPITMEQAIAWAIERRKASIEKQTEEEEQRGTSG